MGYHHIQELRTSFTLVSPHMGLHAYRPVGLGDFVILKHSSLNGHLLSYSIKQLATPTLHPVA